MPPRNISSELSALGTEDRGDFVATMGTEAATWTQKNILRFCWGISDQKNSAGKESRDTTKGKMSVMKGAVRCCLPGGSQILRAGLEQGLRPLLEGSTLLRIDGFLARRQGDVRTITARG